MNAPRWTPGTVLTLGWIVFVTSMLAQSLNLSRVAALVPGIIVPGTLLLLLIQLVIESGIVGGSATAKEAEVGTGADAGLQKQTIAAFSQRLSLSVFWISLLALSAWLLGLVAGPALYCMLFLRWSSGQTWRFSVSYALAVLLIVASVFNLLLKVSPYPGVIAGMLN